MNDQAEKQKTKQTSKCLPLILVITALKKTILHLKKTAFFSYSKPEAEIETRRIKQLAL